MGPKPMLPARIISLASPYTLLLLLLVTYLSLSLPPHLSRYLLLNATVAPLSTQLTPPLAPTDLTYRLATPPTAPTRPNSPALASDLDRDDAPHIPHPALTAARFSRDPDAHLYAFNTTTSPASNSRHPQSSALLLPRTLAQTCHRALTSPVGNASSDGLGHRLTLVLYELNLAAGLDVAYLHRVASYGSLTATDASSVQRLFGWLNYPDLRSSFLRDHCAVVRRVPIRDCRRMVGDAHEYCHTLRPHSPFKRIVRLPQRLTDCLVRKGGTEKRCFQRLRRFANRFQQCGTLFQAFPSRCSFDYGTGGTSTVGPWLRARYWNAHAAATRLLPAAQLQRTANISNSSNNLRDEIEEIDDSNDSKENEESAAGDHENVRPPAKPVSTKVSRPLPFRAHAIQIAVHVRRGDLFVYTHRKMTADATYGAVVAEAIAAARATLGARTRVDVSVFSEGAPPAGERVRRSSHDVTRMTQTYVTESGRLVADASGHWSGVVRRAMVGRRAGALWGLGVRHLDGEEEGDEGDGVTVRAFIATDTIVAIHTMLCADLFVGSRSGLSFIVAAKLGRGVMLLPQFGQKRDDARKRTYFYNVEGTAGGGGPLFDGAAVSSALRRVLGA